MFINAVKAVIIAASLAAMAVIGTGNFHKFWPEKSAPVAASAVLVSDASGHGSGVHIGNGYIVTAAHVVEENATMDVTDSLGHKQKATVLWSNKVYDVALIRVEHFAGLRAARIECGALPIGSEISAQGNPLGLLNITTWGRVSSNIAERGPWKLSYIADITIAPGMSGGPVYDREGRVAGIVVGIALMPQQFPAIAPFAISYIVPSRAVCGLMARS